MKDPIDLETYRQAAEFWRIGNAAVRKAQDENRRLGIPNAYSFDGRIFYQMPDGRITEARPNDELLPGKPAH